ncbi:MAG: XRE family transcriptional regulator [Bacteriovorax sp.]|jgi:predicted XRE-type DNA-binding protein
MKKYTNMREFAADFGLPPEYGELAEVKAKITKEIIKVIEKEGLTHQELAEMSGVPRSAVTGIVSGSLQKVTIDRLIRILFALGRTIELKIKIAS